MKKTLFTMGMAVLATLSMSAQKYNIQGTWSDGAGKKVYLADKETKEHSRFDSTTVKADGTFTLQGQLDEARPVLLSYGGTTSDVFIADQPVIKIVIDWHESTDRKGNKTKNLDATVDGGDDQEIFTKLTSMYMSKVISKLGMGLALAQYKDDEKMRDSLTRAFTYMDQELEKGIRNKIDSASHTMGMPYFVTTTLLSEYPVDTLRTIYSRLTPKVKASSAGKKFESALAQLSMVSVGGQAPDFKLKGPDGKEVSLSSLRGHIVLLDFWATWCGPCLRELPNVKKIYDLYHSKGLEILGVSLDDEKDAEKWKQMIKDREMSWHHGSSLMGWDCPVAKTYNVTAIPRMYIIDKDGKIIAQDLRGEALQEKMAELFK